MTFFYLVLLNLEKILMISIPLNNKFKIYLKIYNVTLPLTDGLVLIKLLFQYTLNILIHSIYK